MASRLSAMPDNVQLKILSLLSPPTAAVPPASSRATNNTAAATTATSSSSASSNAHEGIVVGADANASSSSSVAKSDRSDAAYRGWAEGLACRMITHGYAWQDEMLPPKEALAMLRAVQKLPSGASTEALRPAGMGASVSKWKDNTARGDSIAWVPLSYGGVGASSSSNTLAPELQALCASSGWSYLRATLAQMVATLNRHGAGDTPDEQLCLPEKVMLAHYPAGARYVRHSDVSPSVPHRRVTAILYLNEDWTVSDGGELLIHNTDRKEADCYEAKEYAPRRVAPRLGRMLLFRSKIEHEVCVTNRPRWAVTAWLSLRNPPPKAAAPPQADGSMSMILQLAALATARGDAIATQPPAKQPEAAAKQPEAPAATEPPPSAAPVSTAPPSSPSPSAASPSSSSSSSSRPNGWPLSLVRSVAQETARAARATIFVSIASYRDPEAPFTLRSMFEQAAAPARLIAGVCFQCDETDDADCYDLSGLRPEWRANVRSLRIPWADARGPVWARYLIQKQLFRGEEYFLQIDSHTRFGPRWDEELIEMLSRCDSSKPVLTTYPLPYHGTGTSSRPSEEAHLTTLCTRASHEAFGADEMLRFRARLLASPPPSPLPTPFWAAGFSFSAGSLVSEVPYDPHLPFLFFGEEISIALRMWTRGWDLFAPDKHLLFHLWERNHRATFWELKGAADLKRASQERVRRLLTGKPLAAAKEAEVEDGGGGAAAEVAAAPAAADSPPGAADPIWGLGEVRSLPMYEAFSGVDFAVRQVSAQAECGGMPGEHCFWDRFASLQAMLETKARAEGEEVGEAREEEAAVAVS